MQIGKQVIQQFHCENFPSGGFKAAVSFSPNKMCHMSFAGEISDVVTQWRVMRVACKAEFCKHPINYLSNTSSTFPVYTIYLRYARITKS